MEPGELARAVLDEVVAYLRGDGPSGPEALLRDELWTVVRPRLLDVTSRDVLDRLGRDPDARLTGERALGALLAADDALTRRVTALLAGLTQWRSPWETDDSRHQTGAGPIAPPASGPRPASALPPTPEAPRVGRASPPAEYPRRSVDRGPRPAAPTGPPTAPGARRGAREATPPVDVPPSRLVSTGMATAGSDARILRPSTALGADRDYLYWLGIGDLANRLDTGADQVLPISHAVPGTRLTVIVFPFTGEIVIDPAHDTGELEFRQGGGLTVARQPDPGRAPDDSRLWFPVRTPARPGSYRLRSGVYLGARLLQSRVLEVRVTRFQHPAVRPALASHTDYTVTETLSEPALRRMQPPRVSVLVNDGPGGSHDFRFVGTDGDPGRPLHGTASVDADTVADMLKRARSALRRAAWGTDAEWTSDDSYRYENPRPQNEVEADLFSMAIAGWRIWSTLRRALANGMSDQPVAPADPRAPVQHLTEVLRSPGSLELACRENLRLAVPTAMIYDYRLDTAKSLRFCPDAQRALSRHGHLGLEPCFTGACRYRDADDVVCPGGFWGYRHDLGVPVSLRSGGEGATDITPHIRGADGPVLVVGSTTDQQFTRRLDHLGRLQQLHVPIDWRLGEERQAVMDLLKQTKPHVVYFLCHGVEEDGLPGLVVGDPAHPVAITPDNLDAYEIAWPETRPLVVLNGCRTTALDPTKPHNFVEKFVREAFASGVLGTEITIFEPLACDFAEEVLQRFVHDDITLGRAVRESRLALLRRGNPLGLAYVAYAPVELRMV